MQILITEGFIKIDCSRMMYCRHFNLQWVGVEVLYSYISMLMPSVIPHPTLDICYRDPKDNPGSENGACAMWLPVR
jgi:hypothetical protein